MTNFPLPNADAQTRPFWDGCQDGRLMCQRCAACGTVQFTPRASCQNCHESELEWLESARLGTVMTYTHVHRAPVTAFRDKTPYVIAILAMDEGFRLMVNASDVVSESIRIGSRVRVGFARVDDMALPVAKEFE